MKTCSLDATGLNVPEPILKIALAAADLAPGDLLEVVADYPGFETDLELWCRRLAKELVSLKVEGVYRRRAWIRF